jgi:hypothetical protein
MEKMGEECRLGYGEDAVLNYGGKPNHNSSKSPKSLESHRDEKLTRPVIRRVQRVQLQRSKAGRERRQSAQWRYKPAIEWPEALPHTV